MLQPAKFVGHGAFTAAPELGEARSVMDRLVMLKPAVEYSQMQLSLSLSLSLSDPFSLQLGTAEIDTGSLPS